MLIGCSNFPIMTELVLVLNQRYVSDISTDVSCSLVSLTLTHNDVVFDDHNYL